MCVSDVLGVVEPFCQLQYSSHTTPHQDPMCQDGLNAAVLPVGVVTD